MSVVNRGPVTPRSAQNLGPGDSPTFVQLTLTGLDASKVVVTDTSKKLSSGTNTNAELTNAVSLAHSAVTLGVGSDAALALVGQQLTLTLHARQHALDATADHTIGGLTSAYLIKSDGSKLVPATNTDADVADAVSKKHAAVTLDVNADTVLSLSTQALGLDNQAANLALMGPVTGAAAVPAFRSPQAKDITIPAGVGTPTYDDIQDFLNTTRSAGRLTGGVVSKGTGATISITAMDGMIFTGSTLGTSPLIYFKMPQQTDILGTGAVPNLQDTKVNWIYIDYNGGTPIYKATTTRSTLDDYTMFTVGRVWVSGTNVEVQASGHSLYNKDRRSHNRLILKYGGMDHVSGAELSAHATPLQMSCSIGNWYIANTAFISPTVATSSFIVMYKTGASPTWVASSALTLFSEVFDGGGGNKVYETYQNGNSLATLTGNNYGVYWVFLCPDGHLTVVLGTSSYANIGAAQAATVPSALPARDIDWSRLIGRIICKKTAAAFYSVESVWATQFTLSAATDHSSLANLTADDHAQYLLVTGARALTGDLDFNALYQCHDLQAPAANGEAIRATTKITEANLESAVDLKHAAVTVSAPIALSTQALSLVNNAGSPATVTALDIGTLANVDTLVPTSKAVTTALAAKLSITSLKFPFYIAAGTLDTIALTADQKLPFYVAGGGASNIPLTT